jgi:hypothetical protein
VFQTAVKGAGIAHATPHVLRHAAITEGVHAGDINVMAILQIANQILGRAGYLVGADRVFYGFELLRGRARRVETFDLGREIDIVPTPMGKSAGLDNGRYLANHLLHDFGANQPDQIEHVA